MENLNLEEIRKDISAINDEMLALFVKRMELSAQVARYKKAHGLPTLDRKREEAILQKVADSTEEEFRSYAIKFFKYIMDLGKEYQDTLR
ncbi:MAG: chorismate mutase [Oscillospiraceae bacterium]|nr:chorismate mutase [Oscillospiraceae bacterium]